MALAPRPEGDLDIPQANPTWRPRAVLTSAGNMNEIAQAVFSQEKTLRLRKHLYVKGNSRKHPGQIQR